MLTRIFVYGSLKRGERLHGALQDSTFIGVGNINGTLFDLGPYPAVVLEGESRVGGEIFEATDPVVRDLDRIEGHPHYYKRERVKELTTDQDVWVYFLPRKNLHKGARRITNGMWSGVKGGMTYG